MLLPCCHPTIFVCEKTYPLSFSKTTILFLNFSHCHIPSAQSFFSYTTPLPYPSAQSFFSYTTSLPYPSAQSFFSYTTYSHQLHFHNDTCTGFVNYSTIFPDNNSSLPKSYLIIVILHRHIYMYVYIHHSLQVRSYVSFLTDRVTQLSWLMGLATLVTGVHILSLL